MSGHKYKLYYIYYKTISSSKAIQEATNIRTLALNSICCHSVVKQGSFKEKFGLC